MDYAIITLHNFLPIPTRATNIIPIYLYLRAGKWPCTPLSPPFLPSTSATSASRTHSLSSFPLSLRRLLSIYREFLATDHSPLISPNKKDTQIFERATFPQYCHYQCMCSTPYHQNHCQCRTQCCSCPVHGRDHCLQECGED